MDTGWAELNGFWSPAAPWKVKMVSLRMRVLSAGVSGLGAFVVPKAHFKRLEAVATNKLRYLLAVRRKQAGGLWIESAQEYKKDRGGDEYLALQVREIWVCSADWRPCFWKFVCSGSKCFKRSGSSRRT